MRRRVAVTGLGVLAPNGLGVEEFAAEMLAGRPAISRIGRFCADAYASQIAGHLPNDPAPYGATERSVEDLRFVRLALTSAKEALEDAGIDGDFVDPPRFGVAIANAIGGTQMMTEHFVELTDEGRGAIDHQRAHQCLPHAATFNTASSAVADAHGLGGPCATLTTGCTGGNDALGFAAEVIRRGEADIMIAGAAEAPITPLAVAAFDAIGALSVRNDDPQSASRPFDRGRDGFVLAEGAGILVLEELEHARKRDARIYAEVRGFASTSNAYHMTDLALHGTDLARSFDLALADARVNADEVDYVNAHGSSTPQNDISETNAIKVVLGDHAIRTPVSSIKSMIGHALAAANAIEAVASVLSIEGGVLPPTINLEEPDRGCDLDYVPKEAREARVDVVASLSSGFGGIHSTLVLSSCP
jgi:3-oxoacyl-(acyl-carrier-protein) synthase